MSEATEAPQVLERIKSLTAEEPPALDVQAIAEAATKRVIEAISAAPSESKSLQAELEPLPDADDAEVNLDEQTAALNDLDEADHSDGATIPAPKEAVTISPEIVALLRGALRARLTHTVLHVLSLVLQEK
jgi:hypothetical protein